MIDNKRRLNVFDFFKCTVKFILQVQMNLFTFALLVMEDNEKDNIYDYSGNPQESEEQESYAVIEEEEYKDPDKSGPNFSQVDSDSEEYNLEGNADDNSKDCKTSSFPLMLKTLINPIEGWKSVRRCHLSPEKAQQGCFYPLLAIFAVSKFIVMTYNSTIKLSQAIVDAVSAFASFFFGYFCIIMFLKALLPKESGKIFDTDFGKVFIILSLSTLCLFYALAEIFPMLWAILIFLPLWTIYIICRGSRFLRFPESNKIVCTAIVCISIIVIPMAISWLSGIILQS